MNWTESNSSRIQETVAEEGHPPNGPRAPEREREKERKRRRTDGGGVKDVGNLGLRT